MDGCTYTHACCTFISSDILNTLPTHSDTLYIHLMDILYSSYGWFIVYHLTYVSTLLTYCAVTSLTFCILTSLTYPPLTLLTCCKFTPLTYCTSELLARDIRNIIKQPFILHKSNFKNTPNTYTKFTSVGLLLNWLLYLLLQTQRQVEFHAWL